MALGRFQAATRITTKTDTSLVSAPGARQRIAIRYLLITTELDAGNGDEKIRIEDGAGGDVIASLLSSDGNLEIHPGARDPILLDENTALNAETTGTGASYFNVFVIYEVKGRD